MYPQIVQPFLILADKREVGRTQPKGSRQPDEDRGLWDATSREPAVNSGGGGSEVYGDIVDGYTSPGHGRP